MASTKCSANQTFCLVSFSLGSLSCFAKALNFPARDDWEQLNSINKFTISCAYFPQACQSCFKTIPKGDVVVMAEFDEDEVACYHAACFCCSTCWELLVDLTYYRYGNKIYCGRHHAELSRQRCFGCDEVRRFTMICPKMTLKMCNVTLRFKTP